MNRVRSVIVALLAGLVLAQGSVRAGEPVSERDVCSLVAETLELQRPYYDVTLRRGAAALERINAGEYDSLVVRPLSQSEPRGLFPLMLETYRNGERISHAQASVYIAVFDSVVVLSEHVGRDAVAAECKFAIEWMDVTRLYETPVRDSQRLSGMRFRRNLSAGSIVTLAGIEPIPAVNHGDVVTILFSSGGLTLQTTGAALQDGARGETIKVRRSDSRKILKATVTGPGTVSLSGGV